MSRPHLRCWRTSCLVEVLGVVQGIVWWVNYFITHFPIACSMKLAAMANQYLTTSREYTHSQLISSGPGTRIHQTYEQIHG
ncbi:hypothetical protein BC830DRAFT_1145152 [Chytriomyces sp. MP71]|nr:hypothetical protein BC830DRAFT_1145152 [Chytriomyces sp. MP71]